MKRRIFAILLVLVVLLPLCRVQASEVDATLQVGTNNYQIQDLCKQVNDSVDKQILTYDDGNGLLRFSNKIYRGLDSKDKEKFMETALTIVSKWGNDVSAKTKNSVYHFISQQDTAVTAALKYLQVNAGANLAEAEKWFAPFNSTVGTILGVLCLLIFMFLGLSIVFDIFYIVIPPFQALLESGSDGKKRPWGVSREAWSAMHEAEKTDEYKNVLSLYFRHRTGTLIIVALAITYLVSGKIYDVVVWFVDAFSY